MKSRHLHAVQLVLLLAGMAVVATPLHSGAARQHTGTQPAEMFTATAEQEGRTTSVTLIINSYSTEADARKLAAAQENGGQTALFSAMDKMHRGRIAFHGSVGHEGNYIRSRPTPQGRSILMVSTRNFTFFELSRGERSRDYPFSVVRLNLDRNGRGSGTLVPVAKIRFIQGGDVRVEPFNEIPVHLMAVRPR